MINTSIGKIKSLINRSDVTKDFVSNSFWSIIGTFVSKFLLFFIWIMVANILKDKLYGEFSIVRSTTMLFADFVGTSIGAAGTNYIAKYFRKDYLKLGRLIALFNAISFGLGFILCLLLLTFSSVITNEVLNNQELLLYIRISALVVLVSSVNCNQIGILQGLGEYRLISKINLVQIIFSFPVYFLGTYFFSLKGAVLSFVFYYVISFLYARLQLVKLYSKYNISPDYNNYKSELNEILKFVLPYIFSGLITASLSWYNETQLVNVSDGYSQMGYYSVINVIVLMVIGVAFTVCIPFVGLMSKYRDAGSVANLEKLNMIMPMQIALFVSVPLILFPEILTAIYGESYSPDMLKSISNFMFLTAFLLVYRQAVARFVAVKEKTWLYLCDSFLWALLSVIFFALLVDFGILGFVVARTASYIVSILVFLPFYIHHRIIPKHLVKDRFLRILFIIPFLVFAVTFLDLNLYLRILVCTAVYVLNLSLIYYELRHKLKLF